MSFLNALAGTEELTMTWDLVLVLLVFIAALLYGFNAGRKSLALFALSVYGSIVLLELFPFRNQIADNFAEAMAPDVISLVLLTTFIVLLYFVFSGSIIKPSLPLPTKSKGNVTQVIFLSAAIAGLLLSVVLKEGEALFGNEISDVTHALFIGDIAQFFWVAAPLAVIASIRSKKD